VGHRRIDEGTGKKLRTAISVALEPDALKAGQIIETDDEILIADEAFIASVKQNCADHAELIQYLDDWESGLLAPPSRAEYDAMPEAILQARRIFRDELNKYRNAHKAKG
jgi:hypothetical protein